MMTLRKLHRRGILAAYIGVLGIVGAPRERVWANELAHFETVPATDFVVAAVGGMRNTASAGFNVSGLSGTVNKAYLYWHGPMNSTNPLANATLRINNQTVIGVNIGYSDDNCWGFNHSQAYRADVTSVVRAERNGYYLLSQFVKEGTNVNANGASLLIFFDDGNPGNNRDIVIFDGNDSNVDNSYDAPGWNMSVRDIHYTLGRAFLQLHVSDGQIYEDSALVLNGEDIDPHGWVFQGTTVQAANDGPSGKGRLWDVVSYEVTDLLAAGSNTLALAHSYLGRNRQPKGDCVSLVVAVMDLPAGAAPPVNHPPVVTGAPLVTFNSSAPLTLRAEASDSDGDPLTCAISIDGTPVSDHSPGEETVTGARALIVRNSFGPGRHTVVFTAHDGAASGSFTTVVNIIDNTSPVVTVENIIVPSDLGRITAAVDYRSRLHVTDDFPGVNWMADRLPGSAFPIGVTTVNVMAVDTAGNRAQRSFTITVTDSLPPVIQCPLDLLRPTDPGAHNAVVRWTCSATDNLPGCTVACTPSSGSVFEIGITTVVCAGRDAAGNTANCMFTVTVVDREPPVLTLPANIVVATDPGQDIALVHYTATVTDNVRGATVVCSPPSGSAFPPGANIVACIASDAAGNNVTGSFAVTVVKRELPANTPLTPDFPNAPGRGNETDVPGSTGDPLPPKQHCLIASNPVLWPANRKLIPVSFWVKSGGKKPKFSSARIVSVTSNEPEAGLDDDDVGSDWEIVSAGKLKLRLRAERDPKGIGRVYTILVEARDPPGNVHFCRTTVTVPVEKPAKKKK
jgi:hypothetical protein